MNEWRCKQNFNKSTKWWQYTNDNNNKKSVNFLCVLSENFQEKKMNILEKQKNKLKTYNKFAQGLYFIIYILVYNEKKWLFV